MLILVLTYDNHQKNEESYKEKLIDGEMFAFINTEQH